MATKPTIVLVPGAWHFPSCFDFFVEQLHAKGYPAKTVAHASVYKVGSNPPKISGHKDDAQAIRDVVIPLIQEDKEIVVFCHSYGGWPTTEALAGLGRTNHTDAAAINKHGGVVRIIYCAAFVGEAGRSQIQMNLDNPDGWDNRWLDFGQTVSKVNKEHAVEFLYADVRPELAQKTVDDLGDMVSLTSMSILEQCAWKEIPSTYILCEKDKAIFASFQEKMAKDVGIEIVRMPDSAHSPFLSQPDELAQIVDRIVKSSSKM